MIINLRSDTQTLPTSEMLADMSSCKLGDDVYKEDPTVNKLELIAAEKLGKEAALFVASGTMGNLCALMSHTHPGEEVILEVNAHIYYYEAGGYSSICGLSPRLIFTENGIMNLEQLKSSLRADNIHYPKTSLLCIENTHNRGGGTVYSLELMNQLCDFAHAHNLKVHVDGARIFNAAIAQKVRARKLVEKADSVMFCLSKGLSAPVGSILAGSKLFIKEARKKRKMLGGGMRQAGVLAAAGIIALQKMVSRLEEDHQNAKYLAEEICNINGLEVNLKNVQTNMVYVDMKNLKVNLNEFLGELKKSGILVSSRPPTKFRIATHRNVSFNDIQKAIKIINSLAKNFL